MSESAYGIPVIVDANGISRRLDKIGLGARDENKIDEKWLQQLLFEHPETLPVDEIDRGYEGLIPVCRELNTPVGPIDVLYVTRNGKLAVLEAKLWRNSEARRKVIGQILDYAKEISRWKYEDLQREVSRVTKRKGNVVYELVREKYPDVDEARFVDEVSRSMSMGRFLLLVVGDGIREGVAQITNFLDQSGNLSFTFGLVEMAVFRDGQNARLVQPRVLAKTVLIERALYQLNGNQLALATGELEPEALDEDAPGEPTELHKACFTFWTGFLKQLHLDDQTQPSPNANKSSNIYFSGPPKHTYCWISAWIGAYGGNAAGVYLTFSRGAKGDALFNYLQGLREEIDRELGLSVEWTSKKGKHIISIEKQFQNVLSEERRAEVYAYLSDCVNRFVNSFRHRISAFPTDQA
jgi:hypothetical protein